MFKIKKIYYDTSTPGIVYNYLDTVYRTVLTILSGKKTGYRIVCIYNGITV